MASVRVHISALAVLASLIASAGTSAAGDGTEKANARFEEGRVLAERGDWARACPKFAESEQILPSGRAIYNLGDCYEHLGKYASALREFEEALRRARAAKKTEIAEVTLRRVTALSPKVSRLVIDARETAGQAAVKVDGELIALTNLGPEGLAIDPGEHVITATAPRKKTWTKTMFFGEERASQSVAVPALEDSGDVTEPPKPRDGAATAGAPSGAFPSRTLGIATGGVGLVAVGIGVALGLAASSRLDHVNAICPGGACPPEARTQGDSDLDAAHGLATGSTVCIVAGAVVAAAGITIAIVDPFGAPAKQGAAPKSDVALVVGPSRLGLVLRY